MTTLPQDFSRLMETIAKKHISGIETLETRSSDSLDFHDVSVWGLKAALEEAFMAGMSVGYYIDK